MEYATPIIKLWDNLLVPLQGGMSDDGVNRLREEVTARLAAESAKGLIIDVSALAYMDSFVTRVVRDLALIARLMGVRTVVCGLSPEVAITVIDMGLELQGVVTALNMERAIEELFRLRAEEENALRIELRPA